jgi:hypothetical protein
LASHYTLDDVKLIILSIDGMALGDHVMTGAVGVEVQATSRCWRSAKVPRKTPQ